MRRARVAASVASAVDEVCMAVVYGTVVGMPWSEIISCPAKIDGGRRGKRWVSVTKVSSVWWVHGTEGMSIVMGVHEIQVAPTIGHRSLGDTLKSCV